jgi:hypothetical protein
LIEDQFIFTAGVPIGKGQGFIARESEELNIAGIPVYVHRT